MPYHIFLQQQVRYIIIETKEFASIFFCTHSYSGDGLGAMHLGHHLSTHVEKENDKFLSVNVLSIFLYI
jgi:hypothetical protein